MQSIEEHYIFCNSNLLQTLQKYVVKYYLDEKNEQVDATNIFLKTNQFIINIDYIYNKSVNYKNIQDDYNKPYLDDSSYGHMFKGNPSTEYNTFDTDMTVYQYILLLKKMMEIYENSFNIDYNETCLDKYISSSTEGGTLTKHYDYIPPRKIENSFLIGVQNLFCKYYKVTIEYITYMKPVYIGSYEMKKDSILIYNICSDINNFNKKHDVTVFQLKPYKTLDLFNSMVNLFQNDSLKHRIGLLVETRNPSFSKAYSLYYKAGFRPMFNILDTITENVLELAQNCINTDPQYIACQKGTFVNILMMKTTDPHPLNDNFIKYYNDIFMSHKARHSGKLARIRHDKKGYKLRYFFDTAIAMAYRCSCIFDKYFNMNKKICEDIVNLITQYFKSNNSENEKIFSTDWNNVINGYDVLSRYNISIGNVNNLYTSALNNPELFRFIACVARNYIDYEDIKDIILGSYYNQPYSGIKATFYSDYTLSIKIDEYYFFSQSSTQKKIYIDFISQDSSINNISFNFNSFNDIENELTKSQVTAFNTILDKFKNPYNNKNYSMVFIPCSISYNTNITGKSDSFNHAVSMLYIQSEKRLLFYESQILYDSNIRGIVEIVKCLSTTCKEIIRNRTGKHSSVQDEVHELHRFKDPDTNESLYSKIQSEVSDDPTGGLCVLLSKIPFFACNLLPIHYDFKIKSDNIRFFTFMLTFYCIKVRTQQILTGETNIVLTNISVIFPYLFCGVHNMIKKFNIAKKKQKSLSTEDQNIENTLENYKNILKDNISELSSVIEEIFIYNEEELPFLLGDAINSKMFKKD